MIVNDTFDSLLFVDGYGVVVSAMESSHRIFGRMRYHQHRYRWELKSIADCEAMTINVVNAYSISLISSSSFFNVLSLNGYINFRPALLIAAQTPCREALLNFSYSS